jgi:hypothetical protein
MRNLTKALAFGTVLLALSGAGVAATAGTTGPGFGPGMMMGYGMMGPRQGFGDPTAHLASVKAELAITAEQSPAWDAYAKVVLDTATAMRASRQTINPDTIRAMSNQDRANFMAGQWDQRDKAQATVKAAAENLVASLDDTQKIKAPYVLPGLAQQAGMPMMHRGMGMMHWNR